MATSYRKPVRRRRQRRYTRWPEAKRAAQIAGVKLSTVYKVLQGRMVSRNVTQAIAAVRRELGYGRA